MAIILRRLTPDDSESFWNLKNTLDGETDFMLFEPGERKKNLESTQSFLQGTLEGKGFIIGAEHDGKLIGYLSAERGSPNRVKHSAYIVTGILSDFRGKGLGSKFFDELIKWSEENLISRLELTVTCINTAAKNLYEKKGFVIEGIKKNSLCVNGEFRDEYYMAKYL